jgi:putative nucleotidyltransferase with HDIG domain
MDAFGVEPPMPGRRVASMAAIVAFAAVVALRIYDPNLNDGVGFLFVIPVALFALAYGLLGGLASAAMSVLAVVAVNLAEGSPMTALGYLNRGAAVFVVGALLGWFADRRRALEAELRTHYESSLRILEQARTRELGGAHSEALQLLAAAAEYRDDGAAHHTRRVAELSAQIAAQLGLADATVEQLREAALLHDVGKLAIPDELLLKPGRLTEAERHTMAEHTLRGAGLLEGSSSPVLRMAAEIAASHHEWWDGSGYPFGLAGTAIPLSGRIVAVADVFDALTHERPYKRAWPATQAIAAIRTGSGSQFEPRVVTAFLETREARAPLALGLITGQGLESPSGRSGLGRVKVAHPEARGAPGTRPLVEAALRER